MKKIAILTINDYNNYGNRLQNYATQEVIKSFGYEVETVVHELSIRNNNLEKKSKIQKIWEKSLKEILISLKYRINKNKISYYKNKRITAFKEFTNSYIHETKFSISDEYIPEGLAESYDYFVTGSDQVWNPIFRFGSPIDFLTFAPKNKRIAYAPSFGISKIPSEYIEQYKKWLIEIPQLSVREHAGAKIIKELTGKDAVVLVDPTLMLSKEKWLSIAKPSKYKPDGKYLLTYFLGGVPKEYKSKIYGIAKMYNLKVVNLADMRKPEIYVTDPCEFIDFINSASLFCTDSFHGVVFSILLERPFIVFDRAGSLPSMNSRIETLLSTFKLEMRHTKFIKNNSIFDVDYSHIGSILEYERKKALDFLRKAFNINL